MEINVLWKDSAFIMGNHVQMDAHWRIRQMNLPAAVVAEL